MNDETRELLRQDAEQARNVNREREWMDRRAKADALGTLAAAHRMVANVARHLPTPEAVTLRQHAEELQAFADALPEMIRTRTFQEGAVCSGCFWLRPDTQHLPHGDQDHVPLTVYECNCPFAHACPAVVEALGEPGNVPKYLRRQAD